MIKGLPLNVSSSSSSFGHLPVYSESASPRVRRAPSELMPSSSSGPPKPSKMIQHHVLSESWTSKRTSFTTWKWSKRTWPTLGLHGHFLFRTPMHRPILRASGATAGSQAQTSRVLRRQRERPARRGRVCRRRRVNPGGGHRRGLRTGGEWSQVTIGATGVVRWWAVMNRTTDF